VPNRKIDCRRREFQLMNVRSIIKSYIIREGMTMGGVVVKLAELHGWSRSVPNFSDKLRRGSLRYHEAVEVADVLGYDIVWKKRTGGGS